MTVSSCWNASLKLVGSADRRLAVVAGRGSERPLRSSAASPTCTASALAPGAGPPAPSSDRPPLPGRASAAPWRRWSAPAAPAPTTWPCSVPDCRTAAGLRRPCRLDVQVNPLNAVAAGGALLLGQRPHGGLDRGRQRPARSAAPAAVGSVTTWKPSPSRLIWKLQVGVERQLSGRRHRGAGRAGRSCCAGRTCASMSAEPAGEHGADEVAAQSGSMLRLSKTSSGAMSSEVAAAPRRGRPAGAR